MTSLTGLKRLVGLKERKMAEPKRITREDVQRIAGKVVESAMKKEKIQNVVVRYNVTGRFEPDIEVLGQLIDVLKTKGKIRKLLSVDIDNKSLSRGEEWTFIGETMDKDGIEHDFTVKIRKGKPQIVNLTEKEEELTPEAEDLVDWAGGKEEAREIVDAMGYGLDDVKSFDPDYDGDAARLEIGSEDWIGFRNDGDAEEYATNLVREDLETQPEIFNQDWLLRHVDESAAEDFFRRVYQEWDEGYAYDIQNEPSTEGYDSRLTDELIQWGVIDEGDAEAEDFDPTDHIDDFVEKMVDDKIEQGNGGFDYYEDNFGEAEARELLARENLIDLDTAADDAIGTDGVAHFLAHYDGRELEVGGTYWYRQN
jgi:hypothetical protein